jgi:hypothetical protein
LQLKTIPDFEARFAWLLNSLWSVASANDLIIAVTLVYWLYRKRPAADRRWGSHFHVLLAADDRIFRRTVALVDKLIAWTMGLSLSLLGYLMTLIQRLVETGAVTRQVLVLLSCAAHVKSSG